MKPSTSNLSRPPIPLGITLILLASFFFLFFPDTSNAKVVTYTYDQFGQVSSAVSSDGTDWKYTYDSIGNRMSYMLLPNVLGDIDGDHSLGLADVILGLQITTGSTESALINKNADVDSSGQIGIAETMYVLQQLSK